MDGNKPPYGPPMGVAVCPEAPYNKELEANAGNQESHDNKGYDSDAVFVKPPTAPPLEVSGHIEGMPEENLHTLCDADLRELCLEYIKDYCCYGSAFVRNSTIVNIVNMTVYHYLLETYGERRETMEKTEPFTGQYIDGPSNGPPPQPWDIPVTVPSYFVDARAVHEIPHTAYVKECWRCVGNCRIRCDECSGNGGKSCWSCYGSGRSGAQRCTTCHGTGRIRCYTCSGTGQITCKICNGRGNLRHFRVLIVTWKNHVENFVTDTSGLPNTLIVPAQGKDVYKHQDARVFPLTNAHNEEVNVASKLMIEKHATAFPQEFIRQQRHSLRAVPFTKAKYFWKQKQGDFYVYGLQRKVYFDEYPQKCCCCTCL